MKDMFDERSTNYDLPLPNQNNPLRIDVERLRQTLTALDSLLKTAEGATNSAMHYEGEWNAKANTPSMPSASTANKGSCFVVSVAGTTMLNGVSKWGVGDLVVSTGLKWIRVANGETFDAAAIQSGTFNQERIPALPIGRITGLNDALNSIAGDAIAALDGSQFRNKLPDGRFDYWFEATSQTASGYGSDTMWRNENVGSTKTHSRQALNPDADLPAIHAPSAKYFSRTVVSSVAGAENMVVKVAKIENVRTLDGKKATLSFYAKADAAKNIAIELSQSFGTGGTPSSDVTGIGSQLVAITPSWTRYSIQIDVPAVTGNELGTNANDCLALAFWFDAGSNFSGRTASLGQQSGIFDLACVQLEEGGIATVFEERPIPIADAIVSRYYETSYQPADYIGKPSAYIGALTGFQGATDVYFYAGCTRFKTEKRTIPTIRLYNPLAGTVGTIRNASSGASHAASVDAAFLSAVGFGNIILTVAPSNPSKMTWHYVADARL